MAYNKDRSVTVNYNSTTSSTYQNQFFQQSKQFVATRTLSGDIKPNWKQAIQAHTSATTPMTAVYESVKSSVPLNGSYTSTNVNAPGGKQTDYVKGWHAERLFLPGVTHTNPVIGSANAQNQAMGKAFQQVKQAQVAMSGGVFLGEMREAIHMLRHPAQALRDHLGQYLNKLGKAKKVKPKKWLDTLSQTWLESCFGWRPFINDIEDAMKAYQEVTKNADEQFRKIRAVGKDSAYIGTTTQDGPPINSFYHYGESRIHEEAIVVIRGEVKRKAIVTTADKARVFGLDPSEFLPTAWELLPWSFLVDYFTNIGDIISAGATDTSGVAWLQLTIIRKRIQKAWYGPNCEKCRQLNASSYISCGGDRGSFEYTRKHVSRSNLSSLVVPSLTFEIPGSTIRELNMLALFTQAQNLHSQDTSKLRGRTFR